MNQWNDNSAKRTKQVVGRRLGIPQHTGASKRDKTKRTSESDQPQRQIHANVKSKIVREGNERLKDSPKHAPPVNQAPLCASHHPNMIPQHTQEPEPQRDETNEHNSTYLPTAGTCYPSHQPTSRRSNPTLRALIHNNHANLGQGRKLDNEARTTEKVGTKPHTGPKASTHEATTVRTTI